MYNVLISGHTIFFHEQLTISTSLSVPQRTLQARHPTTVDQRLAPSRSSFPSEQTTENKMMSVTCKSDSNVGLVRRSSYSLMCFYRKSVKNARMSLNNYPNLSPYYSYCKPAFWKGSSGCEPNKFVLEDRLPPSTWPGHTTLTFYTLRVMGQYLWNATGPKCTWRRYDV